jgi:aspartyl-tRNA(Asn)/glutamyl-tRNA(Gln) amidotransferase subunit C
MSDAFSREQVAAIAALASLELDATEIEALARQLGDILAYADQVRRVDTTGVSPTATLIPRHAAERADVLQPCLDRERALEQAPDAAIDTGFFKVPRVIADRADRG